MGGWSGHLPAPPQALRGGRLPDFLLVGAPKAGTTALHAALAAAPGAVPEPGEGAEVLPVRRLARRRRTSGPGDAHSNQEWIWQRQRYLDLFAGRRRATSCAGESTPFYLYHRDARRRIAADLPRRQARSRCCATRSTGPTPTGCTCGSTASSRAPTSSRRARARPQRVDERLGAVLALPGARDVRPPARRPLRALPARAGAACCATATLVDDPRTALNRVCRFLGVAEDVVTEIPSGNSRPFVHPSVRTRVLGPVVRAGAAAGQFLPPQVWRTASRPLIGQLHQRGEPGAAAAHPRAARRPARAVPRGHRAARAGHRRVLRRLAGPPRRRLVPHPPVAARVRHG